MNKTELRSKYLNIRKNITDRSTGSAVICEKIIKEIKEFNNVFAYYPYGSEVDISGVFDNFSGNLYCPVSYENLDMKFVKCTGKIKTGLYGISEPAGDAVHIIPDAVLVPGVAFDISGGRIGYGKGYYDRFLTDLKTFKIGVCFEEQLSQELFSCDKFDVKMDIIITQKNTYICGKERFL